MARARTTHEEVTVGLVGADAFVRKMIEVGRSANHPALRLVPAIYEQETAVGPAARKIVGQVDSLLFAGPLPYNVAMESGEIEVPAIFVPTGGPALHGALVRALTQDGMDPTRITIDSINESELAEAYGEVELSADGVDCMPYSEPLRPDDFLAFHTGRFRDGKSTGAITTIPSVYQRLQADAIPSVRMVPPTVTLRQALNNAILVGSGARFEESRIAVVIVQVPERSLPPRSSPAQYWYQELRLALHRELLLEARRMDAIVIPQDQHSFLVFTTVGSLRMVTDELTTAPFISRISDALNLDLEVGIGLGSSTVEAETNAYRAVTQAASDSTHGAALNGPDNLMLRLPVSGGQPAEPPVQHREKDVATIRTLIEALAADGSDKLVVDAERVAGILDVTLRTARRTLQSLVESGLAWPLPPARSKKVGRPPMLFQLLDERITRRNDNLRP